MQTEIDLSDPEPECRSQEYWLRELRAVDPDNALKVGRRVAEIEKGTGRKAA